MEFLFRKKKLNRQKLMSCGFVEQDGQFISSRPLVDGQFTMTISISQAGDVRSKLLERDFGEEYVLHRVPGVKGAFVGKVRKEYEDVLFFISENCFDADVFTSDCARQLIEYVRQTYGDELEFLWPKFPENAIFRRKDTQKWYGAILTLPKRKLGLDSDDTIEILDLRIRPEEIERTVDNKTYFPGYHMNKKHWYTIFLDGSVPMEELCRRIGESYRLALK